MFQSPKRTEIELTEKIVDSLFKLGSKRNKTCTRIAFKIGEIGNEVETGGMCRDALKRYIRNIIKKHVPTIK